MTVHLSIYLDKRRAKTSLNSKSENDLKYPVKLRVYSIEVQKAKLYSIGHYLSIQEFNDAWISKRRKLRDLTEEINIVLDKARNTVKELKIFDFNSFEKKMFRKKSDRQNVFFHYLAKIKELSDNDQFSTKSNYELSLKSIKAYLKYLRGNSPSQLYFNEITKKFLSGYEKFIVEVKGGSINTVGIYLRPLRHIFKNAITEEEIEKSYYPFGKSKYVIPSPTKVKKALSTIDLKKLFDATPKNSHQEKAKDFWFFSYSNMGMNIKDIALLKHTDINDEYFSYYRSKTKSSARQPEPIIVYLNEYNKSIIEKYKVYSNGDYVFDIIRASDSMELQHRKIKNFTRFVNQHIKKLASAAGVNPCISAYWARHSFATTSIRNGASIEFVSEALDHKSLKTTNRYFMGFEDQAKKQFSDSLMDFSK